MIASKNDRMNQKEKALGECFKFVEYNLQLGQFVEYNG